LLYSHFYLLLNITNSRLDNAVEDAITNAINSEISLSYEEINSLRELIYNAQMQNIRVIAITLLIFIAIIGYSIFMVVNINLNASKNAFYYKYIEDCIEIIDKIEKRQFLASLK